MSKSNLGITHDEIFLTPDFLLICMISEQSFSLHIKLLPPFTPLAGEIPRN